MPSGPVPLHKAVKGVMKGTCTVFQIEVESDRSIRIRGSYHLRVLSLRKIVESPIEERIGETFLPMLFCNDEPHQDADRPPNGSIPGGGQAARRSPCPCDRIV